KFPSCSVTIKYCGLIKSEDKGQRRFKDQIIVVQQGKHHFSFICKGPVNFRDTFQFQSHPRSDDKPFTFVFYVNGLIAARLPMCCEYKYRNGITIDGKYEQFAIQNISGTKPCQKCKMDSEESAKS
ncbi:unnamed protein product, partial [Didymodactylos carnosus]